MAHALYVFKSQELLGWLVWIVKNVSFQSVGSCEGRCFTYFLEMAEATTRIRMTCSNAGSARAMRSWVAAQYGIQSYFTERNGNFETGHVASIQHANVDMTEYLHPGIPILSSPTPLSSFAKVSSLLRNDVGAAEEAANPRPQQKIRCHLCQHLALHNPQANRLVESEAKLHSTESMQKIIATM